MQILDCLRAKSKSGEVKDPSLKSHILEALKRVVELYEFVENNADSIEFEPFKNEEDRHEFFKSFAVAVIIHDLGKIEYGFQSKLFTSEEKDESEEWEKLKNFFRGFKRVDAEIPRHEILSALWSSFLIGNGEWDKKIRSAIILHHYNNYFINQKDLMSIILDYPTAVKAYLEFLKSKKSDIENLIKNLLSYIENNRDLNGHEIIKSAIGKIKAEMDTSKIDEILEKIELHDDDISELAEFYNSEFLSIDLSDKKISEDYKFIVFMGCLRRCDYSSSGLVNIEYSELESVFDDLPEIIKRKVKRKSLWQEEVLKDDYVKSDGAVLIAPTGSGKTEFAMLWAEKVRRKLIYTLPLRVALNDLYRRFNEIFEGNGRNAPNNKIVDILHSTSFIEYLREERHGQETSIDRYITSAKLLASPVMLATPDQIFLTSLNYYGSDKVISVYPLSSIVIDEIQTYNEEMSAIVINTLEMIKELKGKVLVMTATIPPYYEEFLFNDLKYKKINLNNVSEIKNYNVRRHKICIVEKKMFDYDKKDGKPEFKGKDDVKALIKKYSGKKIMIIVNNVWKAIKIYEELEGKKKDNVFLLHSRLIEKQKDYVIKSIKKKIKKGENDIILVATQIVEASVNLDFDVMITEISPIDSQIQRWGRIYRNRGDKDYSGEDENIVIFIGELENGEYKFDRGTTAIYDKKVLKATAEVLKKTANVPIDGKYVSDKVFGYRDELNLIDKVFSQDVNGKTLKEIYKEKIKEIKDSLKYFTVEKKSEAQRLFRRIAGVQAVLPDLMEITEYDDEKEIAQKFANIIKDKTKRDLSWDEIVKEIYGDSPSENEISNQKWILKKMLYEYSVTIPAYYFDKFKLEFKDEFKGFYVVYLKDKETAEKIKELGIDSVFTDLDDTEIREFESNVI